MITVIKETPIKIDGKDCTLQLILDYAIWVPDACDYCYYNEWNDWEDPSAKCAIVHGCLVGQPTYFKLTNI